MVLLVYYLLLYNCIYFVIGYSLFYVKNLIYVKKFVLLNYSIILYYMYF